MSTTYCQTFCDLFNKMTKARQRKAMWAKKLYDHTSQCEICHRRVNLTLAQMRGKTYNKKERKSD